MTCPHCHKILDDGDFSFAEVKPRLYEVKVNDLRPFLISVDTTLDKFKRTILMSRPSLPYSCEDDFELFSDDDGEVVEGEYVCLPEGSTVYTRDKTTNIELYIYPSTNPVIMKIAVSDTVYKLKEMLSTTTDENTVIFRPGGVEFEDDHRISSFDIRRPLMAIPRKLYEGLYSVRIDSN